MRWSTGEATVERLLAAGHVERVQGAQADGASWLDRARRGLEAARVLAESAPDSSVVLACDAARQACVALLAQQGLRPTTAGGRYVVEEVIRAQFGPALRASGGLRRRRKRARIPALPDRAGQCGRSSRNAQDRRRDHRRRFKSRPQPRILLTGSDPLYPGT